MKCGTRVAIGVGAGYLLGRRRKMRMAMMLAAAGATGKFGGAGYRDLLNRGVQTLGSSPEVGKIAETVRGELVDALKSAAITAASSRVDSLNERLQQRPLRKKGKPEDNGQAEPQDEAADDEATVEADDEATDDKVTDEADEATDDKATDEGEADEEGSDDEDLAEDEDEEPESDQADDDEPEEEPERPAPSRKRTVAQSEKSSGRAPVRRARR